MNSADNIANNISLEHGYYSSAKEPAPVNYRNKIATNTPLQHAYCSVKEPAPVRSRNKIANNVSL